MALSNENNPRMLIVDIGDVTAGAALSLPAMHSLDPDKIKSVTLMNNAALAGDDTNNVQVVLQHVGGNAIATYLNDVASGGLAQRVGKAMPLSSADLAIPTAGDLEIVVSHNGTGGALSRAKMQIELIA